MYPLSPSAFLALADGNAVVTDRVALYTRAQGRLPDVDSCASWKVDYDATSAVYAKGTAVFTDPSLWSGLWSDPLSPWGSEMTIERGVVLVDELGDERTEWIPMGRFVITDVVDALPLAAGAIEVTFADRSTYIADNPADDTMTADPAETFAAAIKRLGDECGPVADTPFLDFTGAVGQIPCPKADLGQSRLDAIHKLAKEISAEHYFDRFGRRILRPVPLATGPVCWEIADTSTFLSAKRTASRQNTYSRVYVQQEVKETGDTAPTPISAVSVDMDPTSPTYHPRFGRSRTYRSVLIDNEIQAQNAADQIRALSLEAGQTVEVTHVPMEALDRGDVVRVIPDSGGPTVQRQVVQSFSASSSVADGPQTLGARGIELPADTDDSLIGASLSDAS